MRQRRISGETAAVLRLFLSEPERFRYGREIVVETGLKSGSLYPMLHRLEGRGLLLSEWEDVDAALGGGRRPRRLYRLDGDRVEEARVLLSEWRRTATKGTRTKIGGELPA
jgi:PadR family transcriptional regulator, regulatory protein PadR